MSQGRIGVIPLYSYTTDMYRFRPLVNEAQKEIWGEMPFRSIIEGSRLNQVGCFVDYVDAGFVDMIWIGRYCGG